MQETRFGTKAGLYESHMKRLLDLLFSMTALIILSPVLVIVSIVVRVKIGKPILYKQDRPGKHEHIFTLYKFRTMNADRDNNGDLLPDEVRLTKVGRLLRSSSLDELPELYNILRGDMSLVGPRPLLVKYLSRYTDDQRVRHDVRPGLTGLSQTSGRNLLSWEQKFSLDVEYVKDITFTKDFQILLNTFVQVIKRTGISSNSSATNEEFFGKSIGVDDNE